MSQPEPLLTRSDLVEVIDSRVSNIVGETVGEIVSDATSLINKRFDVQNKQVDSLIQELRAMKYWLGDHELRIRLLERAKASV